MQRSRCVHVFVGFLWLRIHVLLAVQYPCDRRMMLAHRTVIVFATLGEEIIVRGYEAIGVR